VNIPQLVAPAPHCCSAWSLHDLALDLQGCDNDRFDRKYIIVCFFGRYFMGKNSASSFNPLCMISNQLEFRLKSVFLIVFFIWESGAKGSFPLTLTDDKFSVHKK
jgi:hypothetical protein